MSIVRHLPAMASLWALSLVVTEARAVEAGAVATGAASIHLQTTLDLRPPNLDEIYSPAQIAALLNMPFSEIEEVHVEAVRLESVADSPTPAIPEGLGAVFWSVPNATQAWRILMPVTSDQVDSFSENLDSVVYSQPTALPMRDPTLFP